MSKEFVDFSNGIIQNSKLEVTGGIASKFFENFIVEGMGSKLFKFQENAKELYKEWQKTAGSFLSIADFFVKNGQKLFKMWLSQVFPFNKKYLIIECTSHSAVDSQLAISYYFHEDELKAIKNSLFMNNLKEKKEKDAVLFLFSNAIKSISKYFTLLIGKEYKIFTSSLDSLQIGDDTIIIDFRGAGRVKE
ncbi:MAG: hypothetical protein ACTSRG_11605 [Candidatus Helarchaeota archaeon]